MLQLPVREYDLLGLDFFSKFVFPEEGNNCRGSPRFHVPFHVIPQQLMFIDGNKATAAI
jgi:hypothetical protein